MTSALSAAMALSLGVTAFAADDANSLDGTSVKAGQTIAIAKQGVSNPTGATYTLKITSNDGLTISDKTISLKDTNTNSDGTITLDAERIFSDEELTNIKAKGVGIYTFEVSESVSYGGEGTLTNDGKKYFVQVKVKNSAEDKSGTNAYVISGVTAQEITKEADEENEAVYGNKGDIAFATKFTKEASILISKAVAGDGANYSDEFEYEISFTKDDVNDDLTLKADKNLTQNESTITTGTELNYNVTYKFTLKNNDNITFTVPAGTTYTVKETDTKGYTASATVVENGTATTDKGTVDTVTAALAGEKENKVEFTNTKNASPLTGLFTENAPFIAMIAVAGVAFVAYVAYKKRENA